MRNEEIFSNRLSLQYKGMSSSVKSPQPCLLPSRLLPDGPIEQRQCRMRPSQRTLPAKAYSLPEIARAHSLTITVRDHRSQNSATSNLMPQLVLRQQPAGKSLSRRVSNIAVDTVARAGVRGARYQEAAAGATRPLPWGGYDRPLEDPL